MKPITAFLKSLIVLMIASPTMSKVQAVDQLQLVTNGVSNAAGNIWFDEIAIFYASIGTINTGTFNSWRNSVINDGEVKSNALLDATEDALVRVGTLSDISEAIRFKKREDRVVEMVDEVKSLRTFRDAQTDPVVITALNCGIVDLISKRNGLQQRIGGGA